MVLTNVLYSLNVQINSSASVKGETCYKCVAVYYVNGFINGSRFQFTREYFLHSVHINERVNTAAPFNRHVSPLTAKNIALFSEQRTFYFLPVRSQEALSGCPSCVVVCKVYVYLFTIAFVYIKKGLFSMIYSASRRKGCYT